jgi:uncharacterized protein YjcR
MTRDEARARGRQILLERRAMLREDWLFISDGDPYRMSARQAAERLGVSARTIVRWRSRVTA